MDVVFEETPIETETISNTNENVKAVEESSNDSSLIKKQQFSLPLSLLFLQLAHEALGGWVFLLNTCWNLLLASLNFELFFFRFRRSWCVNSNGVFLLLFVDEFWKSLSSKAEAIEKNRSVGDFYGIMSHESFILLVPVYMKTRRIFLIL